MSIIYFKERTIRVPETRSPLLPSYTEQADVRWLASLPLCNLFLFVQLSGIVNGYKWSHKIPQRKANPGCRVHVK